MFGPTALLLVAALAATSPATGASLRVDGTEFVLRQADGTEQRSAELVGTELDLPNGATLRIDAVEREPTPGGREVVLHRLSVRDGAGGWVSACQADAQGGQLGFPLPGRFDADGTFAPDPATLSLTCTSGAQGKCVRFGYAPWAQAADGTPLLDHYNACIRMVRADYCGDGRALTVDGTIIDVYDRLGLQKSEGGADFVFEAGWSPDGAVCVRHTRIAANGDLGQLLADCPRLRDAPHGDACDDAAAESAGAVLFNRSR